MGKIVEGHSDSTRLGAPFEGSHEDTALARSSARRAIVRGAWSFAAWVSFLAILGLLYVRDENGFWRWTKSLANREYGKLGMGIVMIVALLVVFPPFISAAMLMTGCFEFATGRPFQQIEAWFSGLSWWRKCLVVPALAAPIAVLSYGLIGLGAILVRVYLKP